MNEMKNERLGQVVDSLAGLLNLPIETAWKPAIEANLQVTLQLATEVEKFELPDEAEPAAVFEA